MTPAHSHSIKVPTNIRHSMTVKDQFQSLDFSEIVEPLKKKYSDALLPLSEYKENYDIICNTEFTGDGGMITFRPDGGSDVYLIEGDRYFNIVGMEVVLPDNGAVTAAEAAAEILWCSAPFGRYDAVDWEVLFEEHEADEYALQAKRVEIKIAMPYCRDKEIRRELKQQMMSSSDDLCLSAEANSWFVFGEGRHWGKKQNRSKRKRKYRMKKRRDELFRLSELHKELNLLETKIGTASEEFKQLVLSSSSIETIYFESCTYGKSDRIAYLEDLLLNPLYESKKFLKPDTKQQCICVLYTSPGHNLTVDEHHRMSEIFNRYFGDVGRQIFIRQCEGPGNEIELNITYVNF